VVRRLGLDERLVALSLATDLVFAPPSPRWRCLLRCFLCLRCWCTSTGGLGSLACCGGWRLRRSSTPFSPFCAFWGTCSLGIGEALFLCLWVCLWLSWRRMRWRQSVSVPPQLLRVACVLSQPQEPPYGVDGAVFRGAVVTTRSFSKRGCGGDGGF